MNIHLSLAPLIALLAGILILMVPRLLNYIVAIYLILIEISAAAERSATISGERRRLFQVFRR